MKSCTVLAVQADGSTIVTIEGLGDGGLHPMQQAFHEQHALQCGYCTPGMIMAATHLLERNPDPTEEEIRHGLEGNLCRCTGYQNIVEAVKQAAATMRARGDDGDRGARRRPGIGASPLRKEDAPLLAGRGGSSTTSSSPGCCMPRSCARRTRRPGSSRSTPPPPRRYRASAGC